MSHGLIDIHQHLVYGVDDGAKTWDDTVAMMMEAEKQGIERIIATSHALPGRAHFDYDGYLDKLDEINQYAEQQGWRVRLLPGAEIYYTSKALKKLDAEAIPTLNGSRFVLVEFIPEVKADELFRAMRELANGGYNPILAHVERYYCLQDKQEVIQDLRRLGVMIQMNAKTVLQSKGLFGGKSYIRKLLKEGIREIKEKFAPQKIYIEAQTYAIGFYEREGFIQCSEEFLEDGIPHVKMELEL